MAPIQYLLFSATLAVCIGLTQGCASIRSTPLYRSNDGRFSAFCLPQSQRGVPCKFQIETGVRAEIYETFFIDPATGDVVTPKEHRLYSIKGSPIKTDQNFLVHIPRPCAGTLDLAGDKKGYAFNGNGYLTSIGGSIDDKTIQDITSVLGDASLGGFLKKHSAASDATSAAHGLTGMNRLIAVRDFSYGDPNWHVEFNDWVNQFQQCESQCPSACQQQTMLYGSSIGFSDLNSLGHQHDFGSVR